MITLINVFAFLKGAFAKLAAFTIAHWRIILPCLIVGAILWYVLSLRVERDEAVDNFNALVQLQKDKAAERKLENQRKEQQVQLKINSIMANHTAAINRIKGDYEKLKGDKTAADRDVAKWRERVRLEVARGAAGLPGIPEAAGESAGSGGDCDAAAARSLLATLDRGCSITTADYNALHESWTAACRVHRCE